MPAIALPTNSPRAFRRARKARVADKAAALETALALHELRKARAVSQEDAGAQGSRSDSRRSPSSNAAPTCM